MLQENTSLFEKNEKVFQKNLVLFVFLGTTTTSCLLCSFLNL